MLQAIPGQSEASPFENSGMGRAVFTGPVHSHVTSLVINPAALGLKSEGWQALFGMSNHFSRLSVSPRFFNPDGSIQNGSDASDTTWSPGAVVGVVLNNRKYNLGIAVTTPNAKRFHDNPAWNYHSQNGHLAQGLITLGGTLKFSGGDIMLGLAYSFSASSMHYRFDTDTALENRSGGNGPDCDGSPCGFRNPSQRRRYNVEANRFTVLDLARGALSLGMAVKLGKNFITGSYSVAVTEPELEGSVTLNLEDQMTVLRNQQGEISLPLGNKFYLGLRRPLVKDLDLIAFVRYSRTSQTEIIDVGTFGNTLEQNNIPEWLPRYQGFRDSGLLAIGVEEDFIRNWRWGARVVAETAAVPVESVTPFNSHGHNLTLASGLEFHLTRHWTMQAGLDINLFLPRTVDESSNFSPLDAVACVDSQFEFSACQGTREGRAGPSALGDYQELGLSIHTNLKYEIF